MSITQAMILAAGKGTRMRPLTLTTPKPLVPVADKALILWHIERLRSVGICDIVINVGYLGRQIIDVLSGMDLGVNLRLSDESVLDEPLETAGGIKYALANGLLRDEPFILINGDVWTEYDFSGLINHKLSEHLAHLMLVENPEHNLAGDFSLTGNLVQPKSDDAPSHTFAGISVLSPRLIDAVEVGEIAPLAPFLKTAMLNNAVTGDIMTDKWVDVGTLERLSYVDAYARKLKID
ncbi:nucleotidyltransferase family protein [Moraxella sp. ZY200743]|uniref:nucleotidyltransferase family protein n=1 Tax=Moraxella sp. ZY200743 TaxID=2911970 RepID=UPI003D7DCE3F